MFSVFLIIYTE